MSAFLPEGTAEKPTAAQGHHGDWPDRAPTEVASPRPTTVLDLGMPLQTLAVVFASLAALAILVVAVIVFSRSAAVRRAAVTATATRPELQPTESPAPVGAPNTMGSPQVDRNRSDALSVSQSNTHSTQGTATAASARPDPLAAGRVEHRATSSKPEIPRFTSDAIAHKASTTPAPLRSTAPTVSTPTPSASVSAANPAARVEAPSQSDLPAGISASDSLAAGAPRIAPIPVPAGPLAAPKTFEPSPAPAPGRVGAGEESAVRDVLDRYLSAYHGLDANAAKAIWPSVDVKALGRAFAGLQSQEFDFSSCTIFVDVSRATAECGGTARFVPKVGNRSDHLEFREWTFDMRKTGDRWTIATVNVR